MEETLDKARQNARRSAAPSGFLAVNLPYRDAAATKMFYGDVLGGELRQDGPLIVYWFGDFAVRLGWQHGGGCPVDQEWPHYAFTVTPEQYAGLARRLDAYGIPHGDPWMREGKKYCLMYFRDPAGNQWEMFSPEGCNTLQMRFGLGKGGDYVIDFPALTYDKLVPPGLDQAVPPSHPTGFNHMTLAVRDLEEAGRFGVEVLGGENVHVNKTHITTKIGGSEIGWHKIGGGWTAPDAGYPYCTFSVEPDEFVPLKQKLERFGVPTHDISTHDGADAWMYFRDPSGNLWQLNCPQGFSGAKKSGFQPDFRKLCYSAWNDPG